MANNEIPWATDRSFEAVIPSHRDWQRSQFGNSSQALVLHHAYSGFPICSWSPCSQGHWVDNSKIYELCSKRRLGLLIRKCRVGTHYELPWVSGASKRGEFIYSIFEQIPNKFWSKPSAIIILAMATSPNAQRLHSATRHSKNCGDQRVCCSENFGHSYCRATKRKQDFNERWSFRISKEFAYRNR